MDRNWRKETRDLCSNLCIIACIMALLLGAAVDIFGADKDELRERRQSAAPKFHDGILLIHAKSAIDETAAGFREDPAFYYFTGLENTSGALFAIDGRSGESWLFVNPEPPFSKIQPLEVSASPAVAKQVGIEHVVDWSELEGFLAQRASPPVALYYEASRDAAELSPNISGGKNNKVPLWLICASGDKFLFYGENRWRARVVRDHEHVRCQFSNEGHQRIGKNRHQRT